MPSDRWTIEEIGRELQERMAIEQPIAPNALPPDMVRAMQERFGSLKLAYEYFGFSSEDVAPTFDDRSATELIVEIQAWKARHGRCQYEAMLESRPGLVARIQRVFGDFNLAISRADLNPYEEAEVETLGATYWFNPSDIILAFLNHGGVVPPELPLPVLKWGGDGQPGIRPVTFRYDGLVDWVERNASSVTDRWAGLYHPANVARVAGQVLLFGILPLRQERDPHGALAELRFDESDVVSRLPASALFDPRLLPYRQEVVRLGIQALTFCPSALEFSDDVARYSQRLVDSLRWTEAASVRPSSGERVYSLTLNRVLFQDVAWPVELDPYGVRRSALGAGFNVWLPPAACQLSDVGRQFLSLCLNLCRGEREWSASVSEVELDLELIAELLWHLPSRHPVRIRRMLEPELRTVRRIWPHLKRWEFVGVSPLRLFGDLDYIAPRVQFFFEGNP